MKRQSIHTAFRLIALVVACSTAQPLLADSLIGNTDQPVYGLLPIVYTGQWIATPFRTGADPAQLDSISLYESTYGSPVGSFHVSVYGDNNGLPGSPLANGGMSGPSMPQDAGYQTYTAIQPLTLAANTVYWVAATTDNSSWGEDLYSWGAAENTSYISSVGWSFFGNYHAATLDQGATWLIQQLYGSEGGPQLLEVNGIIIVPEPSTLVLAGLTAAVIMFLSWRNRFRTPDSTDL